MTQNDRLAIEFQEAAARSYAHCREAAVNDRYVPRVRHSQNCAAQLASEAMRHLSSCL